MFTKRTIILNSVEGNLNKAVLSLEKNGQQIKGSVRLYNFKEEPSGVLTLGILSSGEVYKAGLTKTAMNNYEFVSAINKPIDEFTCALVNSYKGEIKPLLVGSSNGASLQSAEVRLASSLGVLQKKSMESVKKILDENHIDLEEDVDEIIEQEMKKSCDENCFLCPYKKAFYDAENEIKTNKNEQHSEEFSQQNSYAENVLEEKSFDNLKEKDSIFAEKQENSLKNNEKTRIYSEKSDFNSENDLTKTSEEDDKNLTFYEEIKEQLGLLFSKYEDAKDLEDIIPNSKFVKIDYDEDGQFYVVGLIYEDDEIKYICYGVPGVWSKECPKELNGLSQWLPLNEDDPQGRGYWLSYQDAGNGENIKIEVV